MHKVMDKNWQFPLEPQGKANNRDRQKMPIFEKPCNTRSSANKDFVQIMKFKNLDSRSSCRIRN